MTGTRRLSASLIGDEFEPGWLTLLKWGTVLEKESRLAGFGNKWADNQRRRFTTSYGISHADREEEETDPTKDRHFTGVRLAWDYTEHFNAGTTSDSDLATNVNLADSSDHSVSSLNAVTVSVTHHVAIKASVQWRFENKPALKTDLDIVAYVELIHSRSKLDPRGRAGLGTGARWTGRDDGGRAPFG